MPGGLHLLDEPALMQDMVAEGGQLVIATHSPTRAFLYDPKSFLRRLT